MDRIVKEITKTILFLQLKQKTETELEKRKKKVFRNLKQDKIASVLGMGAIGLGALGLSVVSIPFLAGLGTLATCVYVTEKLNK